MGPAPEISPPPQPAPIGTLIRGLRKRPEFLFVRAGVKAARPSLIVEARRRASASPEIGFGLTASRKVGGAVVRNRARRRLREAGRKLLPAHGLGGVDYVFVARPATAEIAWARLLDDVQNALIRLRAELSPEYATENAGRPSRSAPRKRTNKAKPAGVTKRPSTESD